MVNTKSTWYCLGKYIELLLKIYLSNVVTKAGPEILEAVVDDDLGKISIKKKTPFKRPFLQI